MWMGKQNFFKQIIMGLLQIDYHRWSPQNTQQQEGKSTQRRNRFQEATNKRL